MKAYKPVFLMLMSLLYWCGYSQEKIQDTLLDKSYDELNTLIYQWLPKDTITTKTIINSYIEKAREEKDSIRMAKGYYYYAVEFGPENGLRYADTIIALTEHIDDKYYPAIGYLSKGYWYYQLDDYKKAIEYSLIGYNYAVERGNIKLQMYIRPMIATFKSRVGDHRGALAMHKEHLNALENQVEYKKNYSNSVNHSNRLYTSHLIAIHNLSLTFLHLKENDSSRIYHQKGINQSLAYKDTIQYYEMVSSSGSMEFYAGNFQAALDSLDKAIPHLTDNHNIAMAHYYKGRSYQALERHKDALLIFLKTDSLAAEINYKFPELRNAYEYLIDHYNHRKERDSQLIYINKILDLDKELIDIRSMDGEIARKYDMPELLRQKETIIRNLENRHKKNAWYKGGLLVAVVLLTVFLGYYYKKQRTYKKRFRELINQNTPDEQLPQVRKQEKQDSGVPQEIFKNIEAGLEKFERKHQFTNPDILLKSLADDLNTNSTYLSRVINTTKDMNFSQYLHHIRIKHIVERLKKEEKLRQYAVEAIAQEAGYKTAQSFTKAFYKETGIYPSYFLKRLKTEVVD
ncbi:helix-turn-helix domain-containing protein [Sinomicrobium sp. M5D2P9]